MLQNDHTIHPCVAGHEELNLICIMNNRRIEVKKRQKNNKSLTVHTVEGVRPGNLSIKKFQNTVYDYYKKHGRSLPWRKTFNPYHILVSEIMLQQTQVQRVLEKYERFVTVFPDFPVLANAPLRNILGEWQGLGYNRRAIALQQIAKKVVVELGGVFPSSIEKLVTFPGIGKATASSITVFAFQKPAVFIETNIRRVFIHCFFQDKTRITDAEILPLVEKTLDVTNPREWYYALMDYGAMLKLKHENPNRKSAHYQKQAPFEGSNRQVRGKILRILTRESALSESEIMQKTLTDRETLNNNLVQMQKEGFIKKCNNKYEIA